MEKQNIKDTYYAILAAVFYALNMPFSKVLLGNVPPTMMAALLYIGAGIGIGAIYMVERKNNSNNKLEKGSILKNVCITNKKTRTEPEIISALK